MSYFEHASAAVELGFSVLPIGSNKKPLVEWKQYQTVPASLEVVQAWEDEFAPWGWGFIVGAVSGIIVVDGDGEEGAGSIAGMGLDPHVATSKGGVHVYVTHPGHKCWNAVKFDPILYPGVDLKGDGGYVRSFCPGVQWLQTEKFEPVAWEALPERVREGTTLGKRGYQRKYKIAGPGEGSNGSKAGLVPDGTRRDFLLSRAGFMHNNGIDEAGLILRLRTLAIERCEGCEEGPPPDLEAEIVKIAADAQTWERHEDKFPPRKAKEEEVEDDGIGPTPDELVDGAALAEDLIAYLSRYIVMSEDAKIVSAFWAIHTHAVDAARYTPYIIAESATRRCGKSLSLDVLRLLTRKPLMATDITVAGLFRETNPHSAVFLDEQDGLGDESFRKYLNAGFQRGRLVIRADNDRGATATVKFEPFSPKMIASIGNLPDTITDRAFTIKLRRKLASETVERFRERKVVEHSQPLRERCAWWSAQNVDSLKLAEPALPDELDDRAQDIAEPLLAIAEKIGGRFPQDLAEAMVRMRSGDSADDGDEKIRLLADIRTAYDSVYQGFNRDRFLSSDTLIHLLTHEKDSPWRERGWKQEEITPVALAAMLREFEIRPVQKQVKGERHKGYERRRFEDTWSRFLGPPTEDPPTLAPVHNGSTKGKTVQGGATVVDRCGPLHEIPVPEPDCNGATVKGSRQSEADASA